MTTPAPNGVDLFAGIARLRGELGLDTPPAPRRTGINLLDPGPTAPSTGIALGGDGYAEAALAAETAAVRTAGAGGRNHQLNTSAYSLGQLVGGGLLTEDRVVAALTHAALAAGLGMNETARTIASGLRSGRLQPRTAPAATIGAGIPLAPGMAAPAAPLTPVPAAEEEPEPYAAAKERLRSLLVYACDLDQIPDPEPLIDDTLFIDSTAWLIGAPGNGKSFVALDIAGCVAAGEPWQGHRVEKAGPVLYIAAEGVRGIKRRVRAWEGSMDVALEKGVGFLPVAIQASTGDWFGFVELARELQPRLVVVDTQARVTVGWDENSARDMGLWIDRLGALREATKACVLVVHHTGRAGTHMRGSSAMDGAGDTVITVTKSDDMLTVENTKQKDSDEFDPLHMRLTPWGLSAILTPIMGGAPPRTDTPAVRQMLTSWWEIHGSDWISASVAIKSEVVSESTFHRVKKSLVDAGILAAEGEKSARRYRMVRAPETPLPHGTPTHSQALPRARSPPTPNSHPP